jgi:hypothetical protein
VDGSETLERAIEIAVRAHAGQLYPARDGERGPYVLHLFRVMLAVEGWEARTAAVLHDVIEDTSVTADELREEGIPERVIDAVVALTHREEDSYTDYVDALAPNPLAREVKLADLADNLATNLAMPPTPANDARIARYESAIAALSAISPPDGGDFVSSRSLCRYAGEKEQLGWVGGGWSDRRLPFRADHGRPTAWSRSRRLGDRGCSHSRSSSSGIPRRV